MFIRAARSYHYFIISKQVIVHGGMAHGVKLRAGACVKNELETRFVIISLMSSGYLSSDAYCSIVTLLYIYICCVRIIYRLVLVSGLGKRFHGRSSRRRNNSTFSSLLFSPSIRETLRSSFEISHSLIILEI